MKTLKFLSLFWLLQCCLACHHKPYSDILQAADTLTYTYPDSACALLEQLEDSILVEPRSTQMYYQLLCIKARDKAYITHTSDSLIRQVIRYYEKKNDKKHLPEAYYYGGRVYSDLGDAPQALGYYQKAAEMLEGSTNYRLLKVLYSQMGKLFLYQGVYEEAMKVYKKNLRCQELLKDSRGIIICLSDIGDTWMALGNADSTSFYYQMALSKAKSDGEKPLIKMIYYRLIDLYTQLKQYDSARLILQTSTFHIVPQNLGEFATVADLYFQLEKLDSAKYYYNVLLESNSVYSQQSAHWTLAAIAQKEGDGSSALYHLQRYNEAADSIKSITDSENIRKMQSLYNYQLHEKESYRLKVQSARQQFWIVSLLLALSILTLIFLICFYINKQKKARLRSSLKELKRQKEEQYRRSAQFIEENKLKMVALEKELQATNQNNIAMQELLLAQKEQILYMNCKIEADKKEQSLAEIAFRQSEIYCKFKDAANNNKRVNAQDWEILRIKVDSCYKEFTARLQAIYPVSDIEMKICLLLKIGINVTGIASLTGRSKSAIVSARKKLYEKTHGENGRPEQWDKIVQSL